MICPIILLKSCKMFGALYWDEDGKFAQASWVRRNSNFRLLKIAQFGIHMARENYKSFHLIFMLLYSKTKS